MALLSESRKKVFLTWKQEKLCEIQVEKERKRKKREEKGKELEDGKNRKGKRKREERKKKRICISFAFAGNSNKKGLAMKEKSKKRKFCNIAKIVFDFFFTALSGERKKNAELLQKKNEIFQNLKTLFFSRERIVVHPFSRDANEVSEKLDKKQAKRNERK